MITDYKLIDGHMSKEIPPIKKPNFAYACSYMRVSCVCGYFWFQIRETLQAYNNMTTIKFDHQETHIDVYIDLRMHPRSNTIGMTLITISLALVLIASHVTGKCMYRGTQ